MWAGSVFGFLPRLFSVAPTDILVNISYMLLHICEDNIKVKEYIRYILSI